ncbi:MAG TPA: universal stress protein [Acidimicrobiales bacterium]|nr:universal stress protein [Acidimicrobiales bacterium]
MSRLVVGASSTDLAVFAAESAISLLGEGHRVILLCVTNPALVASPASDSEAVATARLTLDTDAGPEDVLASAERVEADARSDIDEALRSRHLDDKVRVRVDTGELGETLCRVALEERADLIVLGRRRATRARRLRMVIEAAHCPVLVVNERRA